jgi:hypothetical protein
VFHLSSTLKQEQPHNAPGMKCRGLRSVFMNLHCQPLDDVTLTRPSATLSRWERGWWRAGFQVAISVRRRELFAIELQLQPRYVYCVQNRGGACNEVRFARTESLRTKGACKPGGDARTCDFEAIAILLQLAFPERHGGRSLQKAVSVPKCDLCLSPGRVARGSIDRASDVVHRWTPPPAYAAAPLSTGAKTSISTSSGDAAHWRFARWPIIFTLFPDA